jgi:hypothetical protein
MSYVENQRGLSKASIARLSSICEVSFQAKKVSVRVFNEVKLEFAFADIRRLEVLEEEGVVFALKDGVHWSRNGDPERASKFTKVAVDCAGEEPFEPFVRLPQKQEEALDLLLMFHGKPESWKGVLNTLIAQAATLMPAYEEEDGDEEDKVFAMQIAKLDAFREGGCHNCGVGPSVRADVYCTECAKALCADCDRAFHRNEHVVVLHDRRFPLLKVLASVKAKAKEAEGCGCEFVPLNGTCGVGSGCGCCDAGVFCRPQLCGCVGCFNPLNVAPQPEAKKRKTKK